ncbi:MAG TPA: hypothetical protein VHE35_13865 [Kofleriaceae bacterium]|nr:hypothetical protein [Kofleriaceae bacterium]
MLPKRCPVLSTANHRQEIHDYWDWCAGSNRVALGIHDYGNGVGIINIDPKFAHRTFPQHVQTMVAQILLKYPTAPTGDHSDLLAEGLIQSAWMALPDAEAAAEEITTYINDWLSGAAPNPAVV